MSKMKLTHLYLLLFPNGLLKVGKADDIHRRLDDFRRFWGEPDLAQSYYLAADEKLVFRLERSLHCLLDVHSAGIETGDGKTEVFRSDALAPALQHLDVFLSGHPTGTLRLVKGVAVRQLEPSGSRPSRLEREVRRLQKIGAKTLCSMDRCTDNLRRIHRLISFLMRRQARIPFQWDMENGEIHFRVRNRFFARKGCAAIGSLFQFSLEDSSGATFSNLFTAAGLDDVAQVTISLPKAGEGPRDAYLAYVWGEAVHWLHRLPKRSSAALEDIPKLDFGAIWLSIFESQRRDEGVQDAACTAWPQTESSNLGRPGRTRRPAQSPPAP